MLRREALSILAECYRFIREAGDAQAVLHALVKLLVPLFAAQRTITLVLASLVFACILLALKRRLTASRGR